MARNQLISAIDLFADPEYLENSLLHHLTNTLSSLTHEFTKASHYCPVNLR